MALQKTIKLPGGATGNYIRVASFGWDPEGGVFSAHFLLFADEATAKPADGTKGVPLTPVSFCRLRLSGAQFALLGRGKVTEAAIYALAKTQPLICDLGPTILADAIDV